MATKQLSINNAQLPAFVYSPKYLTMIGGRNTGKTNLVARGIDRMKAMPGSVTTLTSASYKQIMTNILPSAFSYLERLGYQKGIHYFVKEAPPKNFKLPYEMPLNFEHYITFAHPERCWGLALVSMDRKDTSGRGKNIDFEISDEFLTFNMDDYNAVVHASNRGNDDRGWQKYGWHHGAWHFSSMPYEQIKKKIIETAKYYKEQFNIDYIETWRKVVELQLQLLEIDNPEDFMFLYNEMQVLRRLMYPRVSKEGHLFMFTNALDNPQGGGFKWIKEQYRTSSSHIIFLIEIMNQIIDQVRDNYFFLDTRHEYQNANNYDYIDSLGSNWKQLQTDDCRQDADRLNNLPLLISFDWGGRFSGINIQQKIERQDIEMLPNSHFLVKHFNKHSLRLAHDNIKIINFINEFWIKPPSEMIKHLAYKFINFYKYHSNKKAYIINDKHGDLTRNQLKTWNQEFIDFLIENGWTVEIMHHPKQEPPQAVVYKLVNNILTEVNPEMYPLFCFNADRCKNTLISMKNTQVKETIKGLKKDKSSEHINSKVDPLHATHFSDSVGKFAFTYIPHIINSNDTSHVATRMKRK